MKRSVKLFLLLAALATLTCLLSFRAERSDPEEEKKELGRIVTELEAGVSTGNNEPWKKYMADDGILLNRDGKTNTKAEIVDEIRPLPKGKILDIKPVDMKIFLKGESALVSFLADEKLSIFGQLVDTQYPSVMYFEKRNGEWQMLLFTYFEKPVNPAPVRVSREYLERFTGIYKVSEENKMEIQANDTALVFKKPGTTKGAVLYPIGENGRFFRAGTECEYIFTKDDKGDPIMRQRRNWIDLLWYKEK